MKQTLLATFIVASLLMSCGKDENADTQPKYKVIAGFRELDKSSYFPSCTIWKDSITSTFSGGTVVDMAVDGNDVYATGYIANSVTKKTYVLVWKNGIVDTLASSDLYMLSTAIYVSNKDVYVTGYESGRNNPATGKLWKNGVLTTLSKGSDNYIPNDLVVVGNNIYITGYISRGGGISGALLWHNGDVITLDGSGIEGESIFVSGSDVYVGGYSENAAYDKVATIWKNGKATSLTEGSDNEKVNAMFVNGNDVYAGGYTSKNNKTIGKVWKNGVATSMADEKYYSEVNRIFVRDGDVYALGTVSYDTVMLWKNTVPKKLTNGSKIAGGVGLYVN